MLSAGALIWISVRPLLRLAICVGGGFAITKADIFPPVAARGAGQIMLNMAMPSLMFSKIVPAFTADNIHTLGPLITVAFLYHFMGLFLAFCIKQFFWVPHRFRNGILVAGYFGNVGDIPTSVLMSITGSAPFSGSADQTLAVAYISAFIFIFILSLFPLGGHHFIARDFKGPDYELEEVRDAMRQKRKAMLAGGTQTLVRLIRRRKSPSSSDASSEKDPENANDSLEPEVNAASEKEPAAALRPAMHHRSTTDTAAHKHVSFFEETESVVVNPPFSPSTSRAPTEILHSRVTSPTATVIEKQTTTDPPTRPGSPHTETTLHSGARQHPQAPSPTQLIGRRKWISRARAFLNSLLMPGSLAIIISFPIAIITPLRALFISVPGAGIPNAPDGQPPLAFIMDAAQFIGAASVPLGLICLGSALARLKVPRGQWHSLPSGAIIWLAIARMIVLPVLGTVICQALIRINWISRDDKVLQFVCIFLSCLPTATTQVTLTQVYSGTGAAEHLAEFLIPQYCLMFISMPALIFYSLYYIF